jgi:hypothetical protein
MSDSKKGGWKSSSIHGGRAVGDTTSAGSFRVEACY